MRFFNPPLPPPFKGENLRMRLSSDLPFVKGRSLSSVLPLGKGGVRGGLKKRMFLSARSENNRSANAYIHSGRILGRAKRHPSGCRAANPTEQKALYCCELPMNATRSNYMINYMEIIC